MYCIRNLNFRKEIFYETETPIIMPSNVVLEDIQHGIK
jgi:hypothetical protein